MERSVWLKSCLSFIALQTLVASSRAYFEAFICWIMCREERVACSNICWGQSSNTEGTPCTTSSNHKIMRDPPNAAPIIQIFKRTDGVWKPLHVMLSYLLLKAITILKSIMIRLIFRDWNITIKYGICRLLLVMSGLSVWRPFIESFQVWRALGSTWERFS